MTIARARKVETRVQVVLTLVRLLSAFVELFFEFAAVDHFGNMRALLDRVEIILILVDAKPLLKRLNSINLRIHLKFRL